MKTKLMAITAAVLIGAAACGGGDGDGAASGGEHGTGHPTGSPASPGPRRAPTTRRTWRSPE
ncbi:hypothetical protein ACFQHO_29125 [Actinomadura yumaensis]|uniref:hypothetical protein n=1 Tax=Actinomadura yumaensis TaxID=111807 RepID=UPI00361F49C9